MGDENKRIKLSVTISETTKRWFEDKAKETGITQSALIAMALSEYIDQKKTIKAMSDMSVYMNKIDTLVNDFNEMKDSISK